MNYVHKTFKYHSSQGVTQNNSHKKEAKILRVFRENQLTNHIQDAKPIHMHHPYDTQHYVYVE